MLTLLVLETDEVEVEVEVDSSTLCIIERLQVLSLLLFYEVAAVLLLDQGLLVRVVEMDLILSNQIFHSHKFYLLVSNIWHTHQLQD